MRALIIAIYLVMGFSLSAQTVKDELTRINQVLLETDEISFEVEYAFYADSTSDKPKESMTTSFSRSGLYSYYEGMGVTVIQHPTLKLTVDKEGEILLLESISDSVARLMQLMYPVAIDEALKQAKVSTFKQGKQKGILLNYPATYMSGASSVILLYTSQYHITKCIMYSGEPYEFNDGTIAERPRMEMTYTRLEKRLPRKSSFSLDAYVKEADGKFSPTAAFSQFEFMNLTNTNRNE